MFAFLVNAAAMFVGSTIGLLFRKRIKPEICETLQRVVGVIVLIIGLSGLLKSMFVIEEGALKTQNELMLIIIIVLELVSL